MEIEEKAEALRRPVSAFNLFKNKHFNVFRERMAHLTTKEITNLLHDKWRHGTSPEEKAEFERMHALEE